MKTFKSKWLVAGLAILAVAAAGTTTFVTQYGIVIKSPATGTVTGHWNGTNGTITTSGTLVSAGAEVSGPVTTTSPTTNGPAANELVTAEWARTHFSGNGAFFYNSTNLAASAFDPGNTYQYVGSYPTNGSRSYTPAAGAYFGSVITTNRFQQINGPALVQVYLTSSGGAASAQYTVHPEIYYTYDTNSATLLGDFEAADQAVIHGAITNRYDFVVSFPPIISTNANGFWMVRRFKVGTKNGTDTLKLSLGTNSVSLETSTPSSISLTTPAQAGANWVASGSTDSTLPGTATAAGFKSAPVPILADGSGNLIVNFLAGGIQTHTAAGTLNILASNIVAGQSVFLDITAGASDRAVTFDLGTNWWSAKPITISANHMLGIFIAAMGTTTNSLHPSAIQTYP